MNEHPDPYAVLGVTPTATPAEITHAFRAKLRTLHPDTGSAAVSDTQLRQVLAAYGLLRDPDRRADYDRTATVAPAPPPPRSSGPSAPTRTPPNPAGPVQITVTHHRKDKRGAAHATPIVGRAGAPAPLTPPSQAKPHRWSDAPRGEATASRRSHSMSQYHICAGSRITLTPLGPACRPHPADGHSPTATTEPRPTDQQGRWLPHHSGANRRRPAICDSSDENGGLLHG